MEFDLARLQPKERASFALRALYEAAGWRKCYVGRLEEYELYQESRSFLSSEQVITFTDLDGRPPAGRDPFHCQDGTARPGRNAEILLPRERLPPLGGEPHVQGDLPDGP